MVGTAARGVALFVRHHKTGTHSVVFRPFTFLAPALSNADTSQRGMRKAAVVVGVFEVRCRVPRMVVGAKPKILIDTVWLYHFARVHLPVGVGFEFAECADQFRTKHFLQKLGSRLAIAMFAA